MPKKTKKTKMENLKGKPGRPVFERASPMIEAPEQETPAVRPKAQLDLPVHMPKTSMTSWRIEKLEDIARVPKDQIPYVAFYLAKSIKIAAYKGQVIKAWTYHIGGRVDEESEEADPLA